MKKWILLSAIVALVACSTASMAFREDFNGPLDSSLWTVYSNGGNVSVSNGMLQLSTPVGTSAFPYVVLNTNPFPSGNFIMRVGMEYPSVGFFGDGLVAGTLAPTNGQVMSNYDQYRCWQYWADTNHSTTNNSNYHSFEWDYSNGLTAFYMDGVRQTPANDPIYSVQVFDPISRPSTIWIGNGRPTPGNSTIAWSSVSIDYIDVTAVPEPSSIFALLCGIAGIAGLNLRRTN